MFLNPVNTSINSKLYSLAIASARLEDTIVFINIPFLGRIPFSFIWEILYSAIKRADIFPV